MTRRILGGTISGRNLESGDSMASLGSFIANAAILICVLGVMAAVGFYLYQKAYPSQAQRFFAPRPRRLAYLERTALEGGRKLLLVRRDNVEHLIMIGGPIDLVIETGIPAQNVKTAAVENEFETLAAARGSSPAGKWGNSGLFSREGGSDTAMEPRLSLSPKSDPQEKDADRLPPMREVKAAE